MEIFAPRPFLSLLALAIPAILALAGVATPRRAGLASGMTLGLALLFAFGAASWDDVASRDFPEFGVRVDTETCILLLLVAALGAVIVRFSKTYLDGDRGIDRYYRWLLLTLSAVTALVVANDLLVIAISWTAASLALHRLLTFYPDRPAALVAAHKKFLVSRLADACLAASLGLLHADVGSFDLDRIASWVRARADLPGGLPWSMEVAAVLLVLAVALRSAQLPFHGWITQVMEAPTPVSALLHAGVVNVGGFVLIRLAPWISTAVPAQILLVAIGVVSATVAALVMTTRVSVKVSLAWSTSAQMGFMLVQCGLGLWPLALLHLVAHSLYKAYAFLSAGTAVDDWRVKTSILPSQPPTRLRFVGAALGAAFLAFLVLIVLRENFRHPWSLEASDLALTLLLGLSLVPLLSVRVSNVRGVAAVALRSAGIVLLYLGWHALAERLIPARVGVSNEAAWWIAGLGFLALFAVKSALHLRPKGALARSLHPWLFSGLYLDELFTRLTFRIWPPRRPLSGEVAVPAVRIPAASEARS